MGRYYSGDIEGKFWFAVQSSTDPAFFGGEEVHPNFINYYFSKDHIPAIKDGLKQCEEALGKWKQVLDDFFEKHDAYHDEMLVKAGVPTEQVRVLLAWYARLHLGQKILKCVEEKGQCEFEAEL